MVGSAGTLQQSVQDLLHLNLGALAGVQGSIISASENREVRSLLVTSCNRQEGKTLTSIGMAFALSDQASADVLLIDGNFSAPKIHELFSIGTSPGLSELLTSRAPLEEAVRRTAYDRLSLLPLGGAMSNLVDVYRSESFPERITSLNKNFDYVIFDGSSIFGASDASIIARHFDGIVLVVECERTRWEVVQDAEERISKAGGTILGVVLNKRKFYIPKAFYGRG